MSIEAGNILRQYREQKGVSLKEASDELHIRIPYLQALENGRAEIIPSNVQARGFLRIYAEYLNLDAADLIREWDHPGSSPLSQNTSNIPSAQTSFSTQQTPAIPQTTQPIQVPEPVSPITQPYIPLTDSAATNPEPPIHSEQPVQEPAGQAPIETKPEQTEKKKTKKSKEPKERRPLFGKRKQSESSQKTEDPEVTAQKLFSDIGNQLSERRKFLALSLEDCEAQTLIRSIYIESMEDGKFDQLPSFIQARGMLNNYASFLDLDVDAIMLKLATALQLLSQKRNKRGENKRKPTKTAGRLKKFFTPDLFVGIFVIVGIAGVIIYSAITIAAYRKNVSEPTPDLGVRILDQYLETTRTPEFLPTASPTISSGLISSGILPEDEETTTESQESISSQPVQVFITANQRTLMTVISDGKEVFSGRTIPNNTYPFDAENLIELTTGNADALSIVYNQQNLGRLGKIGEVMTIDFSPYSAATPTPQFSPTPTNTYEPTYTPMPETPLPTNTATPYIP